MDTQPTVNGLTTLAANRAVSETLDRLESLAKQPGLTIFARINFSADARRAGVLVEAVVAPAS
jgi:uncharacterized protein (DUF302 family)